MKMKTWSLILSWGGLVGVAVAADGPTVPTTSPATLPGTHATASPSTRPGVHNVNVNEFEKLTTDDKSVIIDVRTAREYAAGHLPGSINIDWYSKDFDKKIAALDKDKKYLVHCAAGMRSKKAAERMSEEDFPNVYNLLGGMNAWVKDGKKTVKD